MKKEKVMTYRPTCIIRAPVQTASGYGAMSRDIVRHIIELDRYKVIVHAINWGMTPMNALDPDEEKDRIILDRIRPEQFQQKPDLYVSISIPTEFRPMGRYNIGITAGIETTQASVEFVKAMNVMDVNFVISEHAKNVMLNSRYEARDANGNTLEVIQCEKPIEVLHNCIDTNIFKRVKADYELEKTIRETLDSIPQSYNFLFVGNWLRGEVGQDRKNVGLLIKLFYEVFKRADIPTEKKPGLILKTSQANHSLLDRDKTLKKIRQIRDSVELGPGESLPQIHLLHGSLTDSEMNSLYNHSKVKTHISLTKGEGFGRPLLEASLSSKPVITTGFSGQLDFLNPEEAMLLGGELEKVHASAQWDKIIIPESKWLSVDPNMAATAMLEAFYNYDVWKKKARGLSNKNAKNFSYQKIRDDLEKLLDQYVPEFDKPEDPKIPQIKMPTLPTMTKQGPAPDRNVKLPKQKKINLPEMKKVEL